MRLSSRVTIDRTPEQVWEFFMNVDNLARWDKSVAKVEKLTSGPGRVGSRFDTIAPPRAEKPGKRMHYVVAEVNPLHAHKAELIDDRMFKYASWRMELTPAGSSGTTVTCDAVFKVRWQYACLLPMLRFSKSAITRDLGYLKGTIEANYPKPTQGLLQSV